MMVARQLMLTIGLFTFTSSMWAQMRSDNGEIRYGNEWIRYDQPYFKIPVAEDGIYRITAQDLLAVGIPAGQIPVNNYRIYSYGEQVPLYISSEDFINGGEFIEFYGEKNRAQLDRYLYENPAEEMLNPQYSLVNDTAAYFLTWSEQGEQASRYQTGSNDLTNLPPKQEWFWFDQTVIYHEKLIKIENSVGVRQSTFRKGEGFADSFRTSSQARFEPANVYPVADSARILLRLATNNRSHQLEIMVDGQTRKSESFRGHDLRLYDLPVALTGSNSTVQVDLKGTGGINDRIALAIATLRYPRSFDFGDASAFEFVLDANIQKRYLEISNFNSGGSTPVLYDLSNRQRITTLQNGGLTRVVVSPNQSDNTSPRRFILINEELGVRPVTLQKVEFDNYDEEQAEFIIISHSRLAGPEEGRSAVKEYADYRSSVAGGGHTTAIIDIEQLYDQFGYGINRHYIAVRNFGHYIRQKWRDPRYFFIIGKGIEADQMRTPEKVTEYDERLFYVPTFGNPGADNLLLAGNTSAEPVIPIGRLAAISDTEVDKYLKKVKAFEANQELPQTIDDKYWMKRILHLGGGDPTIQGQIRSNLEKIADIIQQDQFGADVTAFYKASTDAIEVSKADQLFNLINDGVSVITFFGHSGANTFDFSLDQPENYQNLNKYPIFISLGCYSGQIHNNFKGVSEKFVFAEDRGTIAFLASTGLGFVSSLGFLGEELYENLGREFYGSGLGDVVKRTMAALDSIAATGIRELSQQFTLHGDPSIILNAHPGPDYTIDASSVRFEPSVVDIQKDSFSLTFDLVNLGRATNDSIEIGISQELPNGTTEKLIAAKVPAPYSLNELTFRLPTLGTKSVGLNTIHMQIDEPGIIEEFPAPNAKMNNELVLSSGEKGVPLFFIDNSILPVFPPEFAVVNTSSPTLFASTTNAFVPDQNYLVELDTSDTFNSPLKLRTEISQAGGLIRWQPNMDLEPGKTYYWRVSADSTDAEIGYQWTNSSFSYLPDAEDGWRQGHHWQWLKNQFQTMKVEDKTRQFDFTKGITDLIFSTRIGEGNWLWNGQAWQSPWRISLPVSINVVVVSALNNTDFFLNEETNNFGSIFDPEAVGYFRYDFATPESRQGFIRLLEEGVPEGYYVIIYTFLKDEEGSLFPELWRQDREEFGKDIYSTLENYGAQLIQEFETEGTLPYLLIFEKGGAIVEEEVSLTKSTPLNVSAQLEYFGQEGQMTTPSVGPASNWQTLSWGAEPGSINSNDSLRILVYGQATAGGERELLSEVSSAQQVVPLDFIDAGQHPFLSLKFSAVDPEQRTPPQLEFWNISYTPLPDAALAPSQLLTFERDTLERGETFKMSIAVENITPRDMDSLLVLFEIQDESNKIISYPKRYAPLKAGTVINASVEAETNNLRGPQKIRITANPDEDQPESVFFNNIGEKAFFVNSDDIDPVIDVTFDGLHILEGDLVSPKSKIAIKLIDENKYLRLDDPSLLNISIQYPDGQWYKIAASDPEVEFFTASENEKNEATMELSYEFDQEGEYQLLVQGSDKSENQSAEMAYSVSFRVVLENSISNLLNYPNPFSTSTQFVYTLTGEIPSFFKIQIMTVNGQIVKEIGMEEIGTLRIGTHRTDFRWDGTDDYGDLLANGIYLYRLVAKDAEGKDFESFENAKTESFFTNGLGKLVILR